MGEPIPVLMYHSVAPRLETWAFNHLSLDPALFEDQVEVLARAGYRTALLRDLYRHVSGERELPAQTVVLSFDDGYLDNWVYALPILKKHGFKATVFVSTDFIDRRDLVRPTVEDAHLGGARCEALAHNGFLSVPELKTMIASGLIDIQAHCKTHTWYFTGADVVDFHRPGDRYPWLAWNARPERKSLYLEEDQSQFVPFGSPVYLHRESLVARRYAPPAAAQERLVEWVGANGGDGLFDSPDWRARLEREARRAAPPEGGRYESDADRIARLREEIVASKVHLEDLLGKRLDFLCWPGGAYDGAAVALAGEAGFVAWTLGSKAVTGQRNMPGEDPRWIRRIPVLPWWSRGGRTIAPVDGAFLKLMIDAYRGSASASVRLKMYKARRLLSTWLK